MTEFSQRPLPVQSGALQEAQLRQLLHPRGGVGKRLRYVLAEPHTPEGSASKGGSGASERPPRGSAKMNSVIEAAPAGMKKHYEGYGVRR
jgi:hypothetical protein